MFAQVVVARGGCRSPRLRAAFERVPRHRFVGPGPWQLSEDGEPTASADPAIVYQDVAMALAPERGLTTGLPSLHARCLEAAALAPGERVLHVGAGSGYYTAILAELVGDTGSVTGFEVDGPLAAMAQTNLAEWPWARVEARSGIELPANSADLIYVCAGVQQLPRAWVRALRPGGRLVFPLVPGTKEGGVFLIERAERFLARFICPARFIPCVGAQDERAEAEIGEAFRHHPELVRSLRLSPEQPDGSCWVTGTDWWLSTDLD